MRYLVAVEKGGADHAYGVVVPDLPGCFSGGETLEQALDNVEDAIAQHIELLLTEQLPVQQPVAAEVHQENPEYAGFTWAWVKPNVAKYMKKAQKINVTLPGSVLASVDGVVAATDTWNRSSFLAEAAVEKLMRMQG